MTTQTQTPPAIDTDRSKAIQAAASRIAARHPHMAAMADKAAAIAERGGIETPYAQTARVPSSDGSRTYQLNYAPGSRGWSCTCKAWAYRPATINGRNYCKHILAMVITDRVNQEKES